MVSTWARLLRTTINSGIMFVTVPHGLSLVLHADWLYNLLNRVEAQAPTNSRVKRGYVLYPAACIVYAMGGSLHKPSIVSGRTSLRFA